MEEERTTTAAQPALAHIIERARLTSLLADSGARVILLAAPAGYGKTTLARQWAARHSGPVAWYRTTRASGDVAALAVGLDVVLAAAAPSRSHDPNRIPAVAAANPSPAPLARALIATYRDLTREVLLVIDEYEAAGTAEADELLQALVEDLDIGLLVTSRDRPSWFSPRLTTYGEGLEVGVEELTMTDEEARNVLSRKEAPTDFEPLLETARGWPAVIGLAAMRIARDLPSPMLDPQTLYNFLAAELLDAAPTAVVEGLTLLAAASIGDLAAADVVLGEAGSPILEHARRCGLAHVEGDGGTLSLHPLLRDLLLARLCGRDEAWRTNAVERLVPLIEARRWDETLAASEALPDPEFVSSALRNALPELVRGGRVGTLRRWITVGREAGADRGLVDYADAELALRDADFDRAIALGEVAARSLAGDLAARAHTLAAQAANLSDRAARARSHLSAAERLAKAPDTRQAALWGRFNLAVDNQRSDASAMLTAFELASDNSVEHRIRVAHGRISLALLEGQIEESLADAEVALAGLTCDMDPMVRTSFLNAYAYALGATAQYQRSLVASEEEAQLGTDYELSFVRRYALINRARALIGLRRFESAHRTVTQVEAQLVGDGDSFLDVLCRMYRARLYLCTGDLRRAAEQLALDISSRLQAGLRADYLALRGLIRAASGHTSDAIALAGEARRASHFRETVSMATITEAIAALNDSGGRSVALYELATRSEALDAVVLGLRASPELATRVAGSIRHRDRLLTLLALSNDVALARHAGIAIPRSARRTSPLSQREREVHELIAQGRTNREIATALYISESTTKLHVRHILEKLGVRSRVEAARVWQTSEDEADRT